MARLTVNVFFGFVSLRKVIIMNKLIFIFTLSLTMFAVPKLANAYGETVYYGLYEHPYNSTYRFTPVANGGTFHRQDNSYISGYTRVIFSERLGYPPVEGEDWTFKIKDPATNNQTLAYVSFSYSGQCVYVEYDGWGPYTLTCLSDPSLDYVFYFIGTFGGGCVPTQPYSLGFNHSEATAPDIGFVPTEFEPGEAIFNPVRTVSPYLPSSNGGKVTQVTEGTAVIRITVNDNLGCQVPVQNAEVDLKNTIKSGSGSHKHFSLDTEPGTGKYIESLPVWNTIDTKQINISVSTDEFGVVNAKYKAGLYGVDETITAKTSGIAPYTGGVVKEYKTETNLRIAVQGLVPLDSSSTSYSIRGGYTNACGDKQHNDGQYQRRSHYVTSNTYNKIQKLNDLYIAKTGAPDLCLNDASLMYGGFFDNGGSGRAVKGESVKPYKCHVSHRRGIDVDVNVTSCLDNLNDTVLVNGVAKPKRLILDKLADDELGAFKVTEEPVHYRFFE